MAIYPPFMYINIFILTSISPREKNKGSTNLYEFGYLLPYIDLQSNKGLLEVPTERPKDFNIYIKKLRCYEVNAHLKFIKLPTRDNQLFSYFCSLNNVFNQVLYKEYIHFNDKIDSIIRNVTEHSYNINERCDELFYEDTVLNIRSHSFIILQKSKEHRILAEELIGFITLLEYKHNKKFNSIYKQMTEKTNDLTKGLLLGYSINVESLKNDWKIYVNFLYFKGCWSIDFDKLYGKKQFTRLDNQMVMRRYIQARKKKVLYSKCYTKFNQPVEVFVLPLFSKKKDRFIAIYLSPKFCPSSKNDIVEVYKAFTKKFIKRKYDIQTFDKSNFELLTVNVKIPEFDQNFEPFDTLSLFKSIDSKISTNTINSQIKLRVRIDEKGIEGASLHPNKFLYYCYEVDDDDIMEILVDRSYIVLVYDTLLEQTLFIVNDNGFRKD